MMVSGQWVKTVGLVSSLSPSMLHQNYNTPDHDDVFYMRQSVISCSRDAGRPKTVNKEKIELDVHGHLYLLYF